MSNNESNSSVLVLNENFQPLNICGPRRAVVLVLRERAQALETSNQSFHSTTTNFQIPSVIRLNRMVKRPLLTMRLSREQVFWRDDQTCQYCGTVNRQLTLDHVQPRAKGGIHTWENLVTACLSCNHKKAGRTPEEAKMRLRRVPKAPIAHPYRIFGRYRLRNEWRKFIPTPD